MTVDAHFARIVLLAKAEDAAAVGAGGAGQAGRGKGKAAGGEPSSLLLSRTLSDVAKLVRSQAELCDAAADLRGHLAHILRRKPLPQPPEPEYSVEVVRL